MKYLLIPFLFVFTAFLGAESNAQILENDLQDRVNEAEEYQNYKENISTEKEQELQEPEFDIEGVGTNRREPVVPSDDVRDRDYLKEYDPNL